MNGWGWFFLILFLILLGYGGFVGYKVWNARRHGEPIPHWKTFIPFMKGGASTSNYPSPRSSGPFEWIKDKFASLRQGRTTRGGYEESRDVEGGYTNAGAGGGGGAPARGGRGRGLEDDTWDSQVGGGHDDPYGPGPGGYYEEQELGLAPTPGVANQPHTGASDYLSHNTEYGGPSDAPERGRSQRSRMQNDRLDPFGDQNEAASMRSMSPRPEIDTTNKGHTRAQSSMGGSDEGNTSPISTRKSVFREGI